MEIFFNNLNCVLESVCGSNWSLAQGVNCNPRGIDWPSGDMVLGDPVEKNVEVVGGAYSTISISNYKSKKSHVSKVSSSYFYTRREVYWPTLQREQNMLMSPKKSLVKYEVLFWVREF